MAKKPFEEIAYDPDFICWGVGNSAVSLNLIAKIQLREPNTEEEKKQKEKWEAGKKIYEELIVKGGRFSPSGDRGHTDVVFKITFINYNTQIISVKQDNLNEPQISDGYKPATAKFSIGSFIRLIELGEIKKN